MFIEPEHTKEARDYASGTGTPFVCAPCSSVLAAFRENILAVVETASIPSSIAEEGAILNVLQRAQMSALLKAKAEAIRKGKENDEEFVTAFAKKEFDRMCAENVEQHRKSMKTVSAASLKIAADGGALTKAAGELLRQSSVLLWSSVEVLLRDLFAVACNTHPTFFTEFKSKMQDNEKTRKRFDFKISFEVFEKYGFNGEKALGDIFLEHNQIQDLESLLQAVKTVLACEKAVLDKDALSQIWKLYYRRHLIVHRRGIIDKEHFSRLPQDGKIGDKIQLSIGTFRESLDAVVTIGRALEGYTSNRHSA